MPTPRCRPVTTLMLALRGRPLHAEDQRVVGAFAAQAAIILERHRLSEAAAAAVPIAEGDKMRTALLAAVGHDLRSPLASVKAAVTSLRSDDVEWSSQDQSELLLTADESLDRLTRLVNNLLDMSRLQAGALSVINRRIALDELVPLALDDLGAAGAGVTVDVPDDLPMVLADPDLLERVIANLVGNALRYSTSAEPPCVTGSSLGERVELRVIDRGPGIPAADLDRVFAPFQRLGDTDNTTGVGLGLAPVDTPAGGESVFARPAINRAVVQAAPARAAPRPRSALAASTFPQRPRAGSRAGGSPSR